jgi:ABC-type glycerol-3-phosphate transport system substrate-binding protein
MFKKNQKAILILIGLLFLLSASIYVLPIKTASLPKTSQGIDLTIHVTDQQMPGVENVTDPGGAFWSSPLSAGIDSVTVLSTGGTEEVQLAYLQTLLQGGTADADVVGLGIGVAQFAENGWIIPLDSHIAAAGLDLNDYGSGSVAMGQYKGTTYAFPYFMNLGILFYRKDLMDLEGFTEDDFDTWEELNVTANYILNNESGNLVNEDLVGYVGQLDAYEGGVVNFFEWCGSNGALDLVTGEGEVNINTPQVQDAMQFIKDLVPPQYTGVQGNDYIIPRSGLVHDEGSSVGVWLANNSIFMRQWPFAYGLSLTNGIEFGIAPLPHFEGATGYKTSCTGGAILGIPSDTTGTARQAALNLTFFLGGVEGQEAELTADSDDVTPGVQPLSNFPALKSVYANPPAGFEWIKNWTEQAALTLARPVHPDYAVISSKIADYFSDLLSCQKSVEDALSEMERDVLEIVQGPPEEPLIPGFSITILILSMTLTIGIVVYVRKRR